MSNSAVVIDYIEFHQIPSYPNYGASRCGKIANIVSGKVMKPSIDPHGYLRVGLRKNGKTYSSRLCHRLVAEAFLGPCPDGKVVCHNNGIPSDSRIENLRYGTMKENAADQRLHGTYRHGEDHHCARLTWDMVFAIRREYDGSNGMETREKYGVSPSHLCSIIQKNTWWPVPDSVGTEEDKNYVSIEPKSPRGEENHFAKIEWGDAIAIRRSYGELTMEEIASVYGLDSVTVWSIVHKETWWPYPEGVSCAVDREYKKPPRRFACGESHGLSRLTWPAVREMRRIHREEGIGYRRIAKRFGVSNSTANSVLIGKTWIE